MRHSDDDASFSTAGDKTDGTVGAALTDEDIRLILRINAVREESEIEILRMENRRLRDEMDSSSSRLREENRRLRDEIEVLRGSSIRSPFGLGDDDAVPPKIVCQIVQEQLGPLAAALSAIDDKLGGLALQSSKIDGLDAKLDDTQTRIEGLDTKLDDASLSLAGQLSPVVAALSAIELKLDTLSLESAKIEGVDAKLDTVKIEFEGLDTKLDDANQAVSRLESVALLPETVESISREQLQPVVFALADIQRDLDAAPVQTLSNKIDGLEAGQDRLHGALAAVQESLAEDVNGIKAEVQGFGGTVQAATVSTSDVGSRVEALSHDVVAIREGAVTDKQELLDAFQELKDDLLPTVTEANAPEADRASISAGWSHSLALLSDGTVKAWGGNHTVPAGLGDIQSVSAADDFSLALKADGTVAAWGSNQYGQITVPAHLSNVTAISAGGQHSLALLANKKVVAWGRNSEGQTSLPTNLDNVIAVAAGYYHSLALVENENDTNKVVGWGWNNNGQATVPVSLENVKAIAAGRHHSVALKTDGSVCVWGGGSAAHVPAGLVSVKAISAGIDHSIALLENGTVVAWGSNSHGQVNVPEGLENVVAITAGYYYSLAKTSNGSVVGWGDSGQVTTIPEELRAP